MVDYKLPKPTEPLTLPDGSISKQWYNYWRTRVEGASLEEVLALIAEIQAQLAVIGDLDPKLAGIDSVQVVGQILTGAQVSLVNDEANPFPVSFYSNNESGVKGWNLLFPNWVPNPYADYIVDEDGNYIIDENGNFIMSDDGFPINPDYLPDHNNLNGQQGGNATERYHSTAAENTALTGLAGIAPTGGVFTANLQYNVTPFQVVATTIDGSDTSRAAFSGGGGVGASRGGYVVCFGNESGVSPGQTQVVAGVGSDLIMTSTTAVRPNLDNSTSLGTSGMRWSVVYAATGTINTSDAREKTPVEAFTEGELAASMELAREVGTYQWLAAVQEKGENARRHVGLTVQRAIEVMESHDLPPFEYGFICFDSWDETPEQWSEFPAVTDATGKVLTEASVVKVQEHRTAGSQYSFRMDELLLFIARGQDERLRRLEEATFGAP